MNGTNPPSDDEVIDALKRWPDLGWFLMGMARELDRNNHKGGWKHDYTKALARRVHEESAELFAAVRAHDPESESTTEEVLSEAYDVANMAMMVADTARRDRIIEEARAARRGVE